MLLGFGSRKKEKDYGEVRRTQVEGFKRAFPTAKQVNADDSTFDIAIPSASATAFLRVILPPQFPEAPPTFKLFGVVVRHPWVDINGVVANHPRLHPWDANNSITDIAQQVIVEVNRHVGGSPTVHPNFTNYSSGGGLTGYPGQPIPYQPGGVPTFSQPGRGQLQQPPPYPDSRPGMPGYYGGVGQGGSQPPPPQYGGAGMAVAMGGASGSVAASSGTERKKDRPPIQLPPVPPSFPELSSLPIGELNRLLTDEVAFSVLLMNLSQFKECNQMLESARKANADFARGNMTQGEELAKLQEEVKGLQGVLGDMKRSYEDKIRKQQGNQPVSAAESLSLLKKEMGEAATAAEDKSEEIARALTSGEAKASDLLPEFLKVRKEFHERSAKVELLQGLGAGGTAAR